jgi:hypothetical protein
MMSNNIQISDFVTQSTQVLKLIMPMSSYNPNSHPTPYVYSITGLGKQLFVYGSRHFSDEKSPLFAEVCQSFERLRPTLLLTETIREIRSTYPEQKKQEFYAKVAGMSRQEAVQMSEGRLGVKLALECGAAVRGLEPSLGLQMQYLLDRGFTKVDILSFFIFSTLSVSHLYSETMTPLELAAYRLGMLSGESDWSSDELQLDIVERRCREIFGEFPVADHAWFSPRVDPTTSRQKREFSVINEVCIADTEFRDIHFVKEIARGLNEYDIVFVLYGASHAAMQERSLRALFERDGG